MRSLEIINSFDSSFIKFLKLKIQSGRIVFVGSGYEQIVHDCFSDDVFNQNIILGKKTYNKFLSFQPNIWLVNEMSWSLRLLKLYSELNIETIIIDKRSFEGNLLDKFDIIFNNELNINLLLADSKHWQFVQDYTNGKLLNKNLLEYISNLNSNEFIYSGDAEHFGVNLGRFHFERDEVINKLIAFKSILKK